MNEMTVRWPDGYPRMVLTVAALGWFGLYKALISVSGALVEASPVDRNSHL